MVSLYELILHNLLSLTRTLLLLIHKKLNNYDRNHSKSYRVKPMIRHGALPIIIKTRDTVIPILNIVYIFLSQALPDDQQLYR
jgi:hypothetical protein